MRSYAARWAASEATTRAVPLRLLHSYRVQGPRRRSSADRLAADSRQRAEAAELLAATRTALVRVFPTLMVETDMEIGDPRAVLVAESRTARLVVVGARGSGGLAALCLGSVAAGVAQHADSPVVVVRGNRPATPPPPDGPVVVGIDGSPGSDAVLGFAFEYAAARGADLVAVHAWSDFLLDSLGGARPGNQYRELVEEADDMVANWIAPWEQKFPEVSTRRHAVHDRPHRALEARSGFAQLVVVGSRGRGAAAAALLGSTSTALVGHARCPVAVVPTR